MMNQPYLYKTEIFVPDSTDTYQTAYVRMSQNAANMTADGNGNVPALDVTLNSQIPIRVTGKRKYGIVARNIVIGRIQGLGTDQYILRRRIPILDPEFYTTIISQITPPIFVYEGHGDWKLISATNERYNLIRPL